MGHSTLWFPILISALVMTGCAGDAPELDPPAPLAGQGQADAPVTREEASADDGEQAPGLAGSAEPELPGPGEVCPDAHCDDSAICIGGLCHRKCAQAVPSCNDVVRSCTADEVCLPATSFTDACYPASAKTGEDCGAEASGAICRSGNLCVGVGPDGPARCLKLCKYGCADGQCVETNNGCAVCLE